MTTDEKENEIVVEAIEPEVEAAIAEFESAAIDRYESGQDAPSETQRFVVRYIALPAAFLFVALLGGIRFSGSDGSIMYLRPALIYLIFGAGMMTLFFVAGLIRFDGWVSERFPISTNIINGITLAAVYAACVQVFNSVIPESGVLFWLVSFCFLWTLWNNLFANFDTKKLLRSLAAMFGFAFVVKYLVLPYFAAPAEQTWLNALLNNPGQAAITWLFSLPQFAAATGYVQFFVIAIFVIALYFLPQSNEE